jgi:hypothetical protein
MGRAGLVAALLLAASTAACAARPGGGRVHAGPFASPVAAAARAARPGGSGWLRVPGARVRDDTPSLTALYEARWLDAVREAAAWAPAWGPAGDEGFVAPTAVVVTGPAPCPAPPPPAHVHASSPFAAPYVGSGTFAGADVLDHRPGLSVGNGVHSRDR